MADNDNNRTITENKSLHQQQPKPSTNAFSTNDADVTAPSLSGEPNDITDKRTSSNSTDTVIQSTSSVNNINVQHQQQQRQPTTNATQQQQQELWPADPGMYQLVGKIGQGAFATVWKAYRIVPPTLASNAISIDSTGDGTRIDSTTTTIDSSHKSSTTCAVKVLNLDHADASNLVEIRLEVQAMRLLSHPNVLTCHTAFVNDRNLWLITPFMAKGSSLHSLQSIRKLVRRQRRQLQQQQLYDNPDSNSPLVIPEPLPSITLQSGTSTPQQQQPIQMEQHIMYILHETLVGLQYIHENLQIHRDIKAGNILIDADGTVKIADFGVSSFLLLQNGSLYQHEKAKTFVGTPCWMAPEVMEQVKGYDYKADIWSLGITALELAKGYAPYAKYPPMKVLILTIQEEPPSLASYDVETGFTSTDDEYDDLYNNNANSSNSTSIVETYTSNFEDFVRMCLQKDPAHRPTCTELLNSSKHFDEYNIDTQTRQRRMDAMRDEICALVKDVGYKQEERIAAAAAASIANQQQQQPNTTITATSYGMDDATVMAGNNQLRKSSIIQQRVAEVEDRPAGTTWVFTTEESTSDIPNTDSVTSHNSNVATTMNEGLGGPGSGGGVDMSTQGTIRRRGSGQQLIFQDGDYDDVLAELDEFERQTGGEHYDRRHQQHDIPSATDSNTIAPTSFDTTTAATSTVDNVPPQQHSNDVAVAEDDLDQFMDEFEQYTGGEDFRRT